MTTSEAPLVESRGITLEAVRHVLWHLGDERYGVQPGTFTKRLMSALVVADSENRELLAKSFPDLAAAFGLYRAEGDEALRAIARAATL